MIPEKNIDFDAAIKAQTLDEKSVRIKVTATGKGRHGFSIRVYNGSVAAPKKVVSFEGKQKAEILWDVAVTDPEAPWVAVILPDGDLTWKQELFGSLEGL